MLTAKGRDTDVAKGLGVGADAYMTKPFSTKELVAKVRRCWTRRLEERRQAPARRAAGAGRCCCCCLRWAAAPRFGPRWTSRSARCWTRRSNHSGMVLMLVGLGLWALGAWAANLLYRRHVAAGARLLEQAQVRLDGDLPHPLAPAGSAALQGLAHSLNAAGAAAHATARRHGAAGGRGQPPHRTGAQPPGGADVRADAKRGGVQPGRPHPALQPAARARSSAHCRPRPRWPAAPS